MQELWNFLSTPPHGWVWPRLTLRNRAEAAEVIFQSLLISVEIEPSNEELSFFRGHGSELGVLWAEYGEKWDKEVEGERKEEDYRK